MELILYSIVLISVFLFFIHRDNERKKQIKNLIDKIEEFDGSLPCYAPCFICRITQQSCVGRKSCKIYKKVLENGRDERT